MANYQHYNQIIIGKNYNISLLIAEFWRVNPQTGERRRMPRWGKATKQRAKLVREIRAFWVNKWYGETIPEIKKVLVETTNLPEDVIEMLPEYFAYPYEIKSFPC